MNQSEIGKIRSLIQEAQHSYMCAASIAGIDSMLNRVLLKWPDILDSVLKFEENNNKENFNMIISDISPLIYAPMFAVAEALIHKNIINDQAREFNAKLAELKLAINVSDPVHIKNEIIKIVREIDPDTVINRREI